MVEYATLCCWPMARTCTRSSSLDGGGHPPLCAMVALTPLYAAVALTPLGSGGAYIGGGPDPVYAAVSLIIVCWRCSRYVHAHRARYAGMLLLRGAHTPRSLLRSLGLHCPSAVQRANADGRSFSGGGSDIGGEVPPPCRDVAAARDSLRRIAEAKSLLLCADEGLPPGETGLPPGEAGLPPGEAGRHHGGHHDRPGAFRCRAATFAAGEVVTAFAFSRANWAVGVTHFLQHSILFAYVRYAPSDQPPGASDGASEGMSARDVMWETHNRALATGSSGRWELPSGRYIEAPRDSRRNLTRFWLTGSDGRDGSELEDLHISAHYDQLFKKLGVERS